MVGRDFLSFLLLAGISIVVVAVKALVTPRRETREGSELLSDLVMGWIGGWLGSPVFGHWFEGVAYQQVFIIPAFLGAIAAVILKTAYYRPRPY